MKYVMKQRSNANMDGYRQYYKVDNDIWETVLRSFDNANLAYRTLQGYPPTGEVGGKGHWIDFFVEEIDE